MPHVHASVSVTSEPTTADVLRDVRDLLADPARWTQEWYARIDRGAETDHDVYGDDPRATCFCLRGALQRVVGSTDEWQHPASEFLREAVNGQGGAEAIAQFNDAATTRHIDILDALDRAVSAAVLAETK